MESDQRYSQMHTELKQLIGTWAQQAGASLPEVIGILTLTTHEYLYLANAAIDAKQQAERCLN